MVKRKILSNGLKLYSFLKQRSQDLQKHRIHQGMQTDAVSFVL